MAALPIPLSNPPGALISKTLATFRAQSVNILKDHIAIFAAVTDVDVSHKFL